MNNDAIIPIVAILMPLLLVPTIMILRHSSRKREWQHKERMHALEHGHTVPGSEAWPARAAIGIGAVMPVCVFGVAWLSQLTTDNDRVWLAAALVGGTGVLGGTRLAGRLVGGRPGRRGPTIESPGFERNGKPAFNPDAYDAIAHRG